MIIINDKPGQLANRLWSFAPFVALSFKEKIKVHITFFDEYVPYFENVTKASLVKVYHTRLHKLWRKLMFATITRTNAKLLNLFGVNANRQEWANENWPQEKLLERKKLTFLGSWYCNLPDDYMIKEYPKIREFFLPKEEYRSKAENCIKENYKKNSVLVGVHIRRGDYINWNNGKYFYSLEVYRNYLQQLKEIFKKEDKDICVLVCSNEKIEPDFFEGLNAFSIENASAIEDLYALSLCNYIIGPPSTYSMWASFYGKVPMKFLSRPDERIKLSDFSHIIAQNKFSNGSSLVV